MVQANQVIQLSNRSFWDVDMGKLDYQAQAKYIIRKVFEYGSWEDVLEVVAYYGEQKTTKALTSSPYLMEKTMILASKLFNIPISSFKCSNTKQYHPIS